MRSLRVQRRRTSGAQTRRGAVMVEFGIMLPVLVLVAFGCVDFGRFVYEYNAITNAAGEGASYGSQVPQATVANVKAVVIAETSGLRPALTAAEVTVTTVGSSKTEKAGTVTVTVSHVFTMVAPSVFTYWGLPASVTLGRTVVMPRTR